MCLKNSLLPVLVLLAASCGSPAQMPDMGESDLASTPTQPAGCTPDTCFDYFGFNIYYHEMGKGNKEKIMLPCSAITDDYTQWRFVQPQLAEKYDTVSFDYLGWANSDRPHARLTLYSQAEMMIALMDHLGWQKVHIIGFSLGSGVMLILGNTPEYKSRVASMISVNGTGLVDDMGNFPKTDLRAFTNSAGTGIESFQQLNSLFFYNQSHLTEELNKDLIRQHLHYHHDLVYETLLGDGFPLGIGPIFPSQYSELGTGGVSYVIIATDQDRTQYEDVFMQNFMRVPNAQIQPMIHNCGHNWPGDCPGEGVKAISAWIDAHPTN